MPKKKFYGTDQKRGVVFGRFYRDGKQPLKLDLISLEESEFKQTKRGLVRRTDVEKQRLLHDLYLKRERLLMEDLAAQKEESDLTCRAMLEQWLASVSALRDQRTLAHYQKAVDHLLNCIPAKLAANDLKTKHLGLCAAHLADQFSESTANSYLRDLRAGLRWCQRQRFIEHCPSITFFRITKKSVSVFTEDELLKMFNELERRRTTKRRWELLFRAWWILRWTGIRGGELLFLKWDHVLWGSSEILITDSEGHHVKGRKEEVVPISNKLMDFLKTLEIKNEVWVLDDGQGKQFWKHLNELTAAMRKFQQSIGIYEVKPIHGFRSTLATQLASKKGTNLLHVQKILRHRDISTTMGYVKDDDLQTKQILDDL